jgi:DNA-binding response OmpR family regulator
MPNGRERANAPSRPSRARPTRVVTIAVTGRPLTVRRRLTAELMADGHTVLGTEFTEIASGSRPTTLVHVTNSPDEARDLCVNLRSQTELPIVVICNQRKVDPADVVRLLDAGADDVMAVTEPVPLFLARVRAVVRYAVALEGGRAENVLAVGPLSLDLASRTARFGPTVLTLPRREFSLLVVLARHADEVLPFDSLVRALWPGDSSAGNRRLAVCVTRLRAQLRELAAGLRVAAQPHVGYRLVLP